MQSYFLLAISLVNLSIVRTLQKNAPARTPPMGFNTWNHFGCSNINADVMKKTADLFISTGLAKQGYSYVNMDDCWMLLNRSHDGKGPQIPNPDKFPDGLPAVIDYIHSLDLKFGLYTSKSPFTCAKFAGSCNHTDVDARQYADWGVDYVKDDSCGTCTDTLSDYKNMQASLLKTGRPIVLTIEGNPDVKIISKGGYGQARRVGHDIEPSWLSMVSLIDIGSGLWPYAHNDTGNGAFWNDLDMLEIGNGDFAAEKGKVFLEMARAHYSMWAAMKAVLLLGNDLSIMSNQTLGILLNSFVIQINQDEWGRQAQRISSVAGSNTLTAPNNVIPTITKCNSSRITQRWYYNNSTRPPSKIPTRLTIAPCNSSDPSQLWDLSNKTMKNKLTSYCVDTVASSGYIGQTATCESKKQNNSQYWILNSNNHISSINNDCLDVYNFRGPNIFIGGCKKPGMADENQVFTYDNNTQMLHSALSNTHGFGNVCVAVSFPPSGNPLSTIDELGQHWCLKDMHSGSPGNFRAVPCTEESDVFSTDPPIVKGAGLQNYAFSKTGSSEMGWNNQFGASGPVPHSRWLQSGNKKWSFNADAKTSSLQAVGEIIDDDAVGHVTTSTNFCLDLVTGNLEVWASVLSGWSYVVVFFNRSPSTSSINVKWNQLPENPSHHDSFMVYDVWANQEKGKHSKEYSQKVPALAVVLLILTPA